MQVDRSSLFIGLETRSLEKRISALKPEWDEEDEGLSRYRRGWDALATATLPNNGAGTPETGASTRANANWVADGASENIPPLV
jgi:hypothetical protein